MTDYYIRFFSQSPINSLIALHTHGAPYGLKLQPISTNQIKVFYEGGLRPFHITLTDSNNDTTRKEIVEFIEAVNQIDDQVRDHILHVLTHTQAIVAIHVDDDYNGASALDLLLEIVAGLGSGMFHVEGEGFYENGNLIARL